MPQDYLGMLGFNTPKREYQGPIQLPNTPLEETNPWLAKARDFMGNFTGLGKDRGLLGAQEDQSTAGILGDAAGQLNPERMMLGPMMGVTKFLKTLKNGERVPDVASRLAATERSLSGMIGAGVDAGARSDDLEEAIRLAQRYPRTSAHQSVVHNPDIGENLAGVNRISPDGERIRVEMGPIENLRRGDPKADRMDFAQRSLNNRANRAGLPEQKVEERGVYPFAHTLAHETQHTAQRLLNPNNKGLPPLVGHGLDWYHPLEEAAREGSLSRIYGNRRSRLK